MKQKSKRGETFEFFRTVFYAVILAVIFRSCAYEPFHIPSGSMKSTLLIGDYLFVSKASYGYSRYSFPFGIDFFDGRIFRDEPKRGDIIVFRPPGDIRTDYIKRLVGLPGDRIQMRNGVLYINGTEVERTTMDDFIDDEGTDHAKNITRYMETLPEGRKHVILDETLYNEVDNTGEYVVPEGHYFFMGDNRDNSRDSRYEQPVGFVPEENLIGRAAVIVFSIDAETPWWHFWEWPGSLRWSRFFTALGDK